jgi:crotonobetainyl-CoA:carnitine CoA-transferase CaiB-like acyl-CoA transferase
MNASRQPLEGVRILEPAVLLAAPFASSLMADFGAEVLKLELPGTGDPMRQLGPMYQGQSLWWKATARNKKSVTLDLRTAKGQELFRRLAVHSDVVIENFRPGVMEGWNVGWETLHELNPKLIMVRQTGFGQFGPYSQRPAYGMIVESYAGLPDSLGFADTPPVGSGLGDYLTGLVIVYGVMFALYHRDVHGGPGQVIDNAASEAILRVIGENRVPGFHLGLPLPPKRPASHAHGTMGEDAFKVAGYFETADGRWCALHPGSAGTAIWANLMRAVGREDFLDESGYPPGSEERNKRRTEITDTITQWFGSHSRDEIMRIADEQQITVAPIYSIYEAMGDPHFGVRNTFIQAEDQDLGPLDMVGVMPRFSETPGIVRHTGPAIGQHTEEIYGSLLDMGPEELAQLRQQSVI